MKNIILIMGKINPTFKVISILLIFCFAFSFNKTYSQEVKKLNGNKISIKKLDQYIKSQMDSLNIPGMSIAIINDAKVVYYRTFGIANMQSSKKVDNLTIFQAGSLSKPIFAYFIMKMVEKGVLDLDTPLYKYLPYPDIEYDQRYKQITARMVLCHTTGFPNWRGENKLDIKFDPGTSHLYSGEGYVYLSRVLCKIMNKTPQTMDILFQNEITKPLKMEHASFVKNTYAIEHKATAHNANGVINDASPWWIENSFDPAGALHTEAMSYAKFLIAIMEDKGLKKESIDEMLKEQVQITDENQKDITGWGLGFCRRTSKYGINYAHGGNTLGFTSACMLNRERKFGYVFFTNYDQVNEFYLKLEAILFDD